VHDERVNAIDSDDDGAFERQEADDQRLPDIDVRRLTKVWGSGWLGGDKQRAVDAVSFRAYRGQVTALLVRNLTYVFVFSAPYDRIPTPPGS
jgi:hypothetical protein